MNASPFAWRAVSLCVALFGALLATSGSRTDCIPIEPVSNECVESSDCLNAGEYCAKDAGDCDGVGVCEDRPEACYEIWAPVCGCDGVTYANECFAAGAGVNIDHTGECDPPPPPDECETNADCRTQGDPTTVGDWYCAKAFGDCSGTGVCALRPEACVMIYAPVCGCDRRTYSNACVAARAGVNVRHMGVCADDG